MEKRLAFDVKEIRGSSKSPSSALPCFQRTNPRPWITVDRRGSFHLGPRSCLPGSAPFILSFLSYAYLKMTEIKRANLEAGATVRRGIRKKKRSLPAHESNDVYFCTLHLIFRVMPCYIQALPSNLITILDLVVCVQRILIALSLPTFSFWKLNAPRADTSRKHLLRWPTS